MMSIYTDMVQAGIEIDNHYSDLYVRDCPTARAIIANHGKRVDGWSVMPFISQQDNTAWIDVALEYSPFWESKA